MGKVCVSCGDGIEEPKLSEDEDEMCDNCASEEDEDGADYSTEDEDEDDM